MVITTKAIVLNAIKYADTDLIVKCYTEMGLRTYMVKRIYKYKKGKWSPAIFLPINQLEITANYRNNKTLHFLSDIRIDYAYKTVYTDIRKQTLAMFLSDLLTGILKEEDENAPLYNFLATAFQWLDIHDKIADFHLIFLVNLTRFLGFYPERNFNQESNQFFDLLNGSFTGVITSNHLLSEEKSTHFNMLLGTNFDAINQLNFSKKERLELLDIMIHYLELHLSNFKKPKSIEVLKAVFY